MDMRNLLKNIKLGDLAHDETEALYDILYELEIDHTLEDSKTLEFLADHYLKNPIISKKIEAIVISAQSGYNRHPKTHSTHGQNPPSSSYFESNSCKLFKNDSLISKLNRMKLLPLYKRMLSWEESLDTLRKQNGLHVQRMKENPLSKSDKIKYLMIICSDARMGGLFDYNDFRARGIHPVYVAGNISEVLASKKMWDVFSKLAPESAVVIVGHSHCGAVHCAKQSQAYSGHKNISKLIEHVNPESETENVKQQMEVISKNPGFISESKKKSIRILGAFANFDSHPPSFSLMSNQNIMRLDKALEKKLDFNFRQSNQGQDLSQKQYAHAVVINGSSVPSDSREIFSCCANEIFCVSASDFSNSKKLGAKSIASAEMALLDLLDEHAIASAEYSVNNNSTRHIALLHTDLSVINKWKSELMEKSEIIFQAVERGGLHISSMIYNDLTGEVFIIS